MNFKTLLSGINHIAFTIISNGTEVFQGDMEIAGLRSDGDILTVYGEQGGELSLYGDICFTCDEGFDVNNGIDSYISVEYV